VSGCVWLLHFRTGSLFPVVWEAEKESFLRELALSESLACLEYNKLGYFKLCPEYTWFVLVLEPLNKFYADMNL